MIFYILLTIFLISLVIYSIIAIIIIYHLQKYTFPGDRKTKILEISFFSLSSILIISNIFILISLYPTL